jgi:alpha 1,2-mannosyltransferase
MPMQVVPARNTDLNGVIKSVKQMEDRFNKKFGYPYVFLNEQPFEENFIKFVLRSIISLFP